MKNLFLIIFAAASLFVRADEKSAALLAKVSKTINANTSYRVEFGATASGEQGALSGQLTVSGRKFVLLATAMEVYYDGVSLWNYDKKNREVNVENLDPSDPNVMTNPSKMLAVDEKDFEHRMISDNTVELIPKGSSASYSKMELTVNPSTWLPERVSLTDRQSGDKIEIKVSKFTPNVPVTIETFRYDASKNKGVDVIDFR